MVLVVFIAELGELDTEYANTSVHLRTAAFDLFGCLDFNSVEQDGREITYSIWPDMAHVKHWKEYATHIYAQDMARAKWYRSFRSIVAEIVSDRGFPQNTAR